MNCISVYINVSTTENTEILSFILMTTPLEGSSENHSVGQNARRYSWKYILKNIEMKENNKSVAENERNVTLEPIRVLPISLVLERESNLG